MNGTNGTNNFQSFQNLDSNDSSTDSKEVDLIMLFGLLFRYKWSLSIFILFFGGMSVFLAYQQIPIYESEGTIIISESKNRYSYAGSDLSNLLTTTYGIGVGSTIANELQILASRKLSTLLADSVAKRKFNSNGEVFPLLWRDYPIDSSPIGIDTVAQRIRRKLSAKQINPNADIVQIFFESPSPEEAAYMVNLTMDTYSQLSTYQNRTMAISALQFLDSQQKSIRDQLSDSEELLRVFMNKNDIVSIDQQAQELINSISSLEIEKQKISILLVATKSGINAYQSQLDEIRPNLAEQYSQALAPTLEKYLFELSELKTERLLLLSKNPSLKNSPTEPELVTINVQIDEVQKEVKNLTNDLLNSNSQLYLSFLSSPDGSITSKVNDLTQKLIELRVQDKQSTTQVEALNSRIDILNLKFKELPNNIIELAQLRRDVRINEELFLMVSSQFAEMTLWEKTQFGLGRPLDYAILTSNTISPKKKIWLLIGLLSGICLGIAYIFVREGFNDTIRSSDTIKSYSYAFLGAVPDFKILDGIDPSERQFIDDKSVSNQLITFLDHISPISEAYRRLRINVIYANPDKAYKVIMITSAAKGEGKSTVAANLAVTFSEAEKSVLIIDLDLRRPTQHKIFGENREPGLTDSLFETVKISDITNTTLAPNVDLITVGKKTPEPASVLDSKRLKQLIDKLSERYDHIILDTAPYGIISDSASLLRLVDGIVVVSRFNVTTKKELSFTLEGLNHLNADVLGIVLNAFDPKKSTDYYTNYAYYKRTYSEYYQEEKS